MTRQPRPTSLAARLPALAPEHLLMLTIFGSQETQHRVASELDRRAAMRPKYLRAVARSAPQLRPAA